MKTNTTIATSTEPRDLSSTEIDNVSGGTWPPFALPNRNPVNRYAFGPLLGVNRKIELD